MYNDIITDVHFKNEFKLNKIIGDEKMPKILVVEKNKPLVETKGFSIACHYRDRL